MLHIAVCDDDSYMRAYLSEFCLQKLPGSVIHAYSDGKQLLASEVDLDILLMDIKMEEVNGLETVSRIFRGRAAGSFKRPVVIFITAFDDYVFEALDLFPLHYLLKPLDEEKFERALKRAAQFCLNQKQESPLFFHTKKSHRRICPSEIHYVESNLRKVVIHTLEEALEIYATMDSLADKLGNSFFRCHRGYLVNMEQIAGYDQKTIRLRDGTELLLSKSKYTAFVRTYLRFLSDGKGI